MIKLNEQHFENEMYADREDVLRIQKALFVYRDLFVTLDEAFNIWYNYSSHLAAGWLFLPESDKDIIMSIEEDERFEGYEIAMKEN